ncbi:hypothetical protein RJ639_001913 [Escallonia herrerae]|uniref:Protein kinase domain-containing protein n=1 Tax=Escallonia herrerae TaxID=1293975 RepID=A0AA88XBN4_9ASTE|nr:hypothetical protein RJ639_001913 [Escallonia herrerae]
MTTAPVWWIEDGKPSLHSRTSPKNGFDVFSSSNPFSSFDEFSSFDPFRSFSSMVKWSTIASVVSAVVMTAAVVAIVLAILDCLKKAGSTSPIYTRLATNIMGNSPKTLSSQDIIAPAPTTNYPVIGDFQLHGATMERFLSKMAREKPIRFSPHQLQGFTHDFSTELGSGGYGVVFKGEFPGGEQVAVKVLKNNSDTVVQAQFMAEVSTMGRTYHVNLVRLYGFCFDPKMTALVYEFMENGSLDTFLFRRNQAIEWQKLQEIAIGTAKGIAYLHEECQQGIIHYDIKPENVLLDANLTPKVADFGLAKLYNMEPSHEVLTHFKGTAGYAAPELWKRCAVTHKSDVYSFGILLFEIVSRRRNRDATLSETRKWVPKWTWECFRDNELAELISLFGIEEDSREKAKRTLMVALWCVQYRPEARPKMSTVVKMLEGGVEINPPHNPFEHLETAFFSVSSKLSDSSTSTTEASTTSSFTPMQGPLDIELHTVTIG